MPQSSTKALAHSLLSALRRRLYPLCHYPTFHHPGLKISPDQSQYPFILDSPRCSRHQYVVINSVEELLQIHIYDPPPSFLHICSCLPHCILCAPARCALTFTLMPAAYTYNLSVQVWDFEKICPLIQVASLLCGFCSSGQRFARGFLQIPRRGGHPCRPANDSPCRPRRGLSPPSESALPGAQK